MSPAKVRKTLLQCDFDGTITDKDVSYMLLDDFADGDWRQLLKAYREDKISVLSLNTKAFAMVKADRQSLLEAIKGRVRIRAGFQKLVDYCRQKDFRLVIVSNGLEFYIQSILKDVGLEDIPVFAARNSFSPEGLQIQYFDPDGKQLQDGFKESYVTSFLKSGYQIIYAGNGISDFPAAKRCHHIFATEELLERCTEANLDCNAFTDFNDILRVLEAL